MVPGLDGLSVLKALREAKIKSPALFLSALDEVNDRVEGLQSGGDDYLIKPFAFRELSARIEVLGRRTTPTNTQRSILAGGDIEIDLHKRSCHR